jgi:hypothetical protein
VCILVLEDSNIFSLPPSLGNKHLMKSPNQDVVQEEPPNFVKTGQFFRAIAICLHQEKS